MNERATAKAAPISGPSAGTKAAQTDPTIQSACEDLRRVSHDIGLVLAGLEAPRDPSLDISIAVQRALLAHEELGQAVAKLVGLPARPEPVKGAEHLSVFEAGSAAGMPDRYLQFFPGSQHFEYRARTTWRHSRLGAPRTLGDLAKYNELTSVVGIG